MSEQPSFPALRTESLLYRAHERPVLEGLNLEVRRGEILAVMGRSGSGKTTLLKLIMGLIRPTAGRIWVDGVDISRLGERELMQIRPKLGLVFQNAALFDSLTVAENVAFGLLERGQRKRKVLPQVEEKLALVGMEGTEGLLPAELSGGMKKRVGVARALIMEPNIMLYDEPTAGLDPPTAASLNELIVGLRDRLGVTTMIVSHDIHSLAQVADRAAMLEDGRIVAEGTLDTLSESELPEVKRFLLFWKGERER